MRCILHIGTEKTGSTAIQDYLWLNRDAFEKQDGVHVCASPGQGNNRALPAAFMSPDRSDDFIRANNLNDLAKRRAWKKAFLKAFSKEVVEAAGTCSSFVISSEHFHSRLLSKEEVAELHTYLSQFFDQFEVICYLRRQDQMALSRYSEALRAGLVPDATLPPAARTLERQKRLPPLYDFETLLQRWADSFGEENIRPRIYTSSELVGGDVVQDFIHAAGFTLGAPVTLQPSNPALSAEAQAALLSVNRRLVEKSGEAVLRLRKALVAYLESNAPGKSRQPTADEARQFYAVFRSSNERVARRYFARDALFDEDFSAYPADTREVDSERVLDLLAGFMLERECEDAVD